MATVEFELRHLETTRRTDKGSSLTNVTTRDQYRVSRHVVRRPDSGTKPVFVPCPACSRPVETTVRSRAAAVRRALIELGVCLLVAALAVPTYLTTATPGVSSSLGATEVVGIVAACFALRGLWSLADQANPLRLASSDKGSAQIGGHDISHWRLSGGRWHGVGKPATV